MSHLASQIISTKRALTSFSIIQLRWRMSKRQNSSHGALDNVVETAGIEPAFSPCKSDVLPLNYVPGRWSGWPDLNLRPHAPKTRALPDCATPRCYSIFGGRGGIRTHGRHHTAGDFQDRCIQPLCHPSVGPVRGLEPRTFGLQIRCSAN